MFFSRLVFFCARENSEKVLALLRFSNALKTKKNDTTTLSMLECMNLGKKTSWKARVLVQRLILIQLPNCAMNLACSLPFILHIFSRLLQLKFCSIFVDFRCNFSSLRKLFCLIFDYSWVSFLFSIFLLLGCSWSSWCVLLEPQAQLALMLLLCLWKYNRYN